MTNAAEREPVTVLYFAWMREKVGLPREAIALPDGADTVAALTQLLTGRQCRTYGGFSQSSGNTLCR